VEEEEGLPCCARLRDISDPVGKATFVGIRRGSLVPGSRRSFALAKRAVLAVRLLLFTLIGHVLSQEGAQVFGELLELGPCKLLRGKACGLNGESAQAIVGGLKGTDRIFGRDHDWDRVGRRLRCGLSDILKFHFAI